jgi:hypothetical protein
MKLMAKCVRIAWLLAGLPLAAGAQMVIREGSREAAVLRPAFEKTWSDATLQRLPCEVGHAKPVLDYGLRFRTGYRNILKGSNFEPGKPLHLVEVLRIRPQEPPGEPVWLYSEVRLREVPDSREAPKLSFTTGGGFLLGAGRYQVEYVLMDAAGRRCRSAWTLVAKARETTPLALAAGRVEAFRFGQWEGFKKEGPHAHVLFHASPVRPRNRVAKLAPWERSLLLESLKTFLDYSGLGSARLTAFDVDGRRVIFETDELTPRSFRQLARAMAEADYATVDWKKLSETGPEMSYLRKLLDEAVSESGNQEPIIVLGPLRGEADGKPKDVAALKEKVGRIVYFALSPPVGVVDDRIGSMVRALGGKAIAVRAPEEFPRLLQRNAFLWTAEPPAR